MDIPEFICPICSELAKFAVEAQCCGQTYCQDCARETHFKRLECPACSYFPLEYRDSKLARKVISNIKLDCPNGGCHLKIPNRELADHLM